MLVSGYALGVALGSPLVAIAMARLPRKQALLGLMALFVVGNLGCAMAPDYRLLMVARIVTSLAHGAFFGIASVVAAGLVPRERRAQAVAFVLSGLTLANVLGVPFGTALGQQAGWRSTFWVVSAVGVLAAAAIAWALPAGLAGTKGGLARELGALRHWRVALPMALSMLASISIFSVFTYITPLLREAAGLSAHAVTLTLLLFGVGLTVGNLLGGRLADWRLRPAVAGSFALLMLVLVLFTYTSRFAGPAVATVTLYGALAFALISPLQMWVVDAARDAPNLASTLNQSAFNLGNSIGAWAGGAALTAGVAYRELPWLGACYAAIGLSLAVFAMLPREHVAA
jgi:DHA1 family inner membrane transport protein